MWGTLKYCALFLVQEIIAEQLRRISSLFPGVAAAAAATPPSTLHDLDRYVAADWGRPNQVARQRYTDTLGKAVVARGGLGYLTIHPPLHPAPFPPFPLP